MEGWSKIKQKSKDIFGLNSKEDIATIDLVYVAIFFISFFALIYTLRMMYMDYVVEIYSGSKPLMIAATLASPIAWEYGAIFHYEKTYSTSWLLIAVGMALAGFVMSWLSLVVYLVFCQLKKWIGIVYLILIGAASFLYFLLITTVSGIKVLIYIIWEMIGSAF